MFSALRDLGVDARQLVLPKPAVPTTATVNSAAYEHLKNVEYDWHGLNRRIPFVLVQHTISGCGQLRFEDQQIKLGPGTTMLLQFPHDNRYWLEKGGEWEFFWIALSGSDVLALWKRMILLRGPVHRLSSEFNGKLAGKLIEILQLQDIHPARLSREASDLCTLLCTALMGKSAGDVLTHTPSLDENLHLAADMILDHKGVALPIADLAQSLGYNRHYFSRSFKKQYGKSPVEFREEQRMIHACELLLQTDNKIKVIANACGFDDPNYFTKAFKKRFGVAPLAFRFSRRQTI